jgi:hypothetical protein
MSTVLRKRVPRLEDLLPHTIVTATTLIITLAALLGIFGHFFPAR